MVSAPSETFPQFILTKTTESVIIMNGYYPVKYFLYSKNINHEVSEKSMKKERMANLELLRIVSMLMIVTAHLLNHGNMIIFAKEGTPSYYFVWILFGISFTSINIYLLISSYFLIDSEFSTWRIAKIAGQVFFYSLGITLLFWILGDVDHELKIMVFSVLPVSSDFYWFVSMYIGMYLLSPIMNKLIRSLTKKQLECTIIICFLLISVWPNIIYFSSALNTAGGVSISWFLTVYLFGAYLKLYYKPDGMFTKKIIYAFLTALLIPLSRFIIEFLLKTPLSKISVLDDLMWGYSVFYTYSSILVTIASLFLFIAFLNLRIKEKRIARFITKIASCSFGVYLIHDHLYIRETLWTLIDGASLLTKWYLPLVSIGIILFVYIVCSSIELVRQMLFIPVQSNKKLQSFFIHIDERLKGLWNS